MVGTHGRSIWILDDLTALREWSACDRGSAVAPVRARARPCAGSSSPRSRRTSRARARTRRRARLVHYWLKDEPKDDVVLEVLDEKGALVRTLSSRKLPPAVPEDDPTGGAGAEAAAEGGRAAAGGVGPALRGRDEDQGRQDRLGDPGAGRWCCRAATRCGCRGRPVAHDAARGAPRSARERRARRPRGAARVRARAARRPHAARGDRP